MRSYTENVWDEIEPVTERAVNIGLEKVIDQLADDRAPRPERRRQVRTHRRRAELDETASIAPIRFAAERIIAGNELTHIHYLQRGLTAAKAVGRVVVRDKTGTVIGYGTGFLVADCVLATNAHVLLSRDEVANSAVQFRYELDAGGGEITPVEFGMRATPEPIITREMDLTLAAVEPVSTDGRDLAEFGWLRLDPTPGKAVIGEYLTIIQHPGGERKQICVRENKLLKYDANGPYVWYQTDTVGGSSGSPVFNNNWDVVALHHSAVPRTDVVDGRRVFLTRKGQVWDPSMGDDAIDWFANEGIRISRIIEYLRAVWPAHPLAQEVLRAEQSPLRNAAESAAARPSISDDGVLRLNLPIEVRIGQSGVAGFAPRPSAPATDRRPLASVTPLGPTPLERVEVDQSNYDERNGYDEHFLGQDLPVPLPTIPRATLQEFGQAAQNGLRLKYYNYSVVFNKERRLAYYSACNVRADLLKGSRPADDDWFHDPRLGDSQPPLEIDDSWYGQQRTFEADRRFNPFDRGHLCARNHLQWGKTDEEAKRNGDESYHFTNCSPQHWQFNQNSSLNGLWFATEDEVLKLTAAKQLCVINGPVFEAPHSHQEPDGQWRLDPNGERAPDPVFGGVAVPKQFFKIIVWKDQHLRCVGFVVTQEGLLETVERMVWPDIEPEEAAKPKGLTDGETALYRLPISTIASLTGLQFGELEDIPSPLTEELALESQSIENLGDLGREIARA